MSWNPFAWGAQRPADLKSVAADATRTVDALEAAATAATVARQTSEIAAAFRDAAARASRTIQYVAAAQIHPNVLRDLKEAGYVVEEAERAVAEGAEPTTEKFTNISLPVAQVPKSD
jgi:hypothetical protein